jgi:hypothetical protein
VNNKIKNIQIFTAMATAAPLQPTAAHKPAPTFEDTQVNSATTTNQSITPPSGPVSAQLFFFEPPADGSAPFNYVEKPPEGQPQRNFGAEQHTVTINDIRNAEHNFSLAQDAFEAIRNVPSQMTYEDWSNDAKVQEVYYREVEQLLLHAVPGAKRIYIFDHTVRRAPSAGAREPVLRVHIDQTAAAAIHRVRFHLPEEADELLQSRYRLINVWRPLSGPVVSTPLAYASGRTVRDSDLVGVQHRYPDRTGETAGVKYNENQQWYYWSGMKEDERVLLQCFDSENEQGRVPHSAFVDPRTKEGWPARESIELRALVFG